MIFSGRKALLIAALAAAVWTPSRIAPGAEPPRLEFTRMVAHWAEYASPDYLPFIDEAQPEIVPRAIAYYRDLERRSTLACGWASRR